MTGEGSREISLVWGYILPEVPGGQKEFCAGLWSQVLASDSKLCLHCGDSELDRYNFEGFIFLVRLDILSQEKSF